MFYVSNVAANIIFTIAQMLYSFGLGGLALILFSKITHGTSAQYWYDQSVITKVSSFFSPGVFAGRGIRTPAVILAILFTFFSVMLNYLPALLFFISPTSRLLVSQRNDTRYINVDADFINPVFSPADLPNFTQPSGAIQSVNDYLCLKIGGCVNLEKGLNHTITWQQIDVVPARPRAAPNASLGGPQMAFYSFPDNSEVGSVHIHGLNLGAIDNPERNGSSPVSTVTSWDNNTVFVFQQGPSSSNTAGDPEFRSAFSDYVALNNLTTAPWNATLDMSYFGTYGRVPFEDIYWWGEQFFSAQQWTVAHTSPINSVLIWQSVMYSYYPLAIPTVAQRLLTMFDIQANTTLATSIQNLYETALSQDSNSTFLISKMIVEENQRTIGLSCKLITYMIKRSSSTQPTFNLYCSQTFTQMWTINHPQNPLNIVNDNLTLPGNEARPIRLLCDEINKLRLSDNVNDPVFYRAYRVYQSVASVPCPRSFNISVPLMDQQTNCSRGTLYLPTINGTKELSKAAWQLATVTNSMGLTIAYQYGVLDTFVNLHGAAAGIVIGSIIVAIGTAVALHCTTQEVQRQTLYEALRTTAHTQTPEDDTTQKGDNMLELAYSKERGQMSLMLDNEPIVAWHQTSREEENTLIDESISTDEKRQGHASNA